MNVKYLVQSNNKPDTSDSTTAQLLCACLLPDPQSADSTAGIYISKYFNVPILDLDNFNHVTYSLW